MNGGDLDSEPADSGAIIYQGRPTYAFKQIKDGSVIQILICRAPTYKTEVLRVEIDK